MVPRTALTNAIGALALLLFAGSAANAVPTQAPAVVVAPPTPPSGATVWRVWYTGATPNDPSAASQIIRGSREECARELENLIHYVSSSRCPGSRLKCDTALLMLRTGRCVPEQTAAQH
jgi:hypothetical protein